jgi:hypothetical protein
MHGSTVGLPIELVDNQKVLHRPNSVHLSTPASLTSMLSSMKPRINPQFTQPDIVVLENLCQDVEQDIHSTPSGLGQKPSSKMIRKCADETSGDIEHDKRSIAQLRAWNDPDSAEFCPTIFTSWDNKDIPAFLNEYMCKPYARIAMQIVRHPTDVVFLTHIIQYMTINLGSAIWLFRHFTYLHAFAHTAYTAWCIGAFTLLLHNHIHNNGVLHKNWAWLDKLFPYVLEPLMGHTWDSYYYHHVKHHHIESNGTLKL